MQSPHRMALASALLLTLTACGPGEVNQEDAAELAAEFEAGAKNAADETEAQVLRERANSLREVTEGNEAAKDRVKVIGE